MKRLTLLLLLAASPLAAQTYNAQGELLNACRMWDGVDYLAIDASGAISVSGPLTDVQLRATPVPVSGTVGVSGTVPVSGPLTNTQLRATPVDVAMTGTVNSIGKITDGNVAGQADVVGSAPSGTEQGLVVRNIPSGTQAVSGSFSLAPGAAVDATIVAPLSTTTPNTTASAVTVRQALTNRTSSGTLGALNATVALTMDGMGGAGFEIDAGLVGTVLLEATIDGTNWWTVEAYDFPNKDTQASIVTADLPFRGRSTIIAVTSLRLRVSAYTSGSSAARMLGTLGSATASTSTGGGGGGLSQVEGVAADGSPVSGNPVMMGAEAMQDGTAPSSVSAGAATRLLATSEGRLLVSFDHPRRIRCTAANLTATTVQALGGDCVAPGAGLSLYVTGVNISVSVASTTTVNQYMQLLTGTGGACGTGQTQFWFTYHQAMSPVVDNVTPPIKLPPNQEMCWFDSIAGSKIVNVRGYIAP